MLVYTLPGPEHDEVGGGQRLEGLGYRRRRPGSSQTRSGRRLLAVIVDSPATLSPPSSSACSVTLSKRRGQHPAAHLEHPRRLLHRAFEVAGDVGQRGDEEVAEAVALKAAVLRRSGTGTGGS